MPSDRKFNGGKNDAEQSSVWCFSDFILFVISDRNAACGLPIISQ